MMIRTPTDRFKQLSPEEQEKVIEDAAAYRQLQQQRQGQSVYGESISMPDKTLEDFIQQLEGVDQVASDEGYDRHPILGQDGGAPHIPSVLNHDDIAELLSASDNPELLLEFRKKYRLRMQERLKMQQKFQNRKSFNPRPY